MEEKVGMERDIAWKSLTDEQNKELATSYNMINNLSLILTGLTNLFGEEEHNE